MGIFILSFLLLNRPHKCVVFVFPYTGATPFFFPPLSIKGFIFSDAVNK